MATLISVMESIYTYIMTIFSTAFATIKDNPVLFLPVLIALAGSVIFYVIKLIRKFGVRGVRGR